LTEEISVLLCFSYWKAIQCESEFGDDLAQSRESKTLRRKAQIIFQDPYESLNPRQTVFQAVSEPLRLHKIDSTQVEKEERVLEVLDASGLKPPEDFLQRYPQEFSGGQRQRVVIASALILNPMYLVADKPVSMLDVSIQVEILNLLIRLRVEHGITMLYITHDLASAAYLADRLAVMYLGTIVEIGAAKMILGDPKHPYTKSLISLIPVSVQQRRRKQVVLKGKTPNTINLSSGCRFHPRCPEAIPECAMFSPKLEIIGENHQAACLLLGQDISLAVNMNIYNLGFKFFLPINIIISLFFLRRRILFLISLVLFALMSTFTLENGPKMGAGPKPMILTLGVAR